MRIKLFSNAKCREVLLGGIAGAVIFLTLYGTAVLNPAYFDWTIAPDSCSDTAQHAIGGAFYLKSNWSKHPLLFNTLSFPENVSVTMVDGIPVAALITKIFVRSLGKTGTYQYLGLWGLLCFVLQGVFAALLLHKLCRRQLFRYAGILLLCAAPVLWQRFPMHSALSAHFLILWALLLWTHGTKLGDLLNWCGLIILSMLIHPYLCAIVLIMALGRGWSNLWQSGDALRLQGIALMIAALAAAGIGYVLTGCPWTCGFAGAIGFGQNGLNLTGLLNPQNQTFSHLLASRPSPQNGESFMYLGAGLLLLLLLYLPALCRLVKKRYSQPESRWFVWTLAALTIFALSNVIYFDNYELLRINLPAEVLQFCNIFRSSSRFFWPVYYTLIAALVVLASLDRKYHRGILCLAAAFLLQCCDLGGGAGKTLWAKHLLGRQYPAVSEFDTQEFTEAAGNKQVLCMEVNAENFREVGRFALNHNLALTDYHFARDLKMPEKQHTFFENNLQNSKPFAEVLYLLPKEQWEKLTLRNPALTLYGGPLGRWWGIY